MFIAIKEKKKLINELNKALGWELRAQALYAHYGAYLKGLEAISWKSHFGKEAEESVGHAGKVRDMIALVGGEAVTTRDAAPILHTEDLKTMLTEARKTETAAAKQYQKVLPLVRVHPVLTHTILHILMDEIQAAEELEAMLGG
ncbi:MAG: hypothetical protein HY304_01720 [candidate division Zixibacteria bacterium]|nr:hypothetical protein [candidate division Zixibacteria bacterium]